MRHPLFLLVAAAIALPAGPALSSAQAQGTFDISACGSQDPTGAGFANFATRDMAVKRGCTPYGKGVRGLVVAVKHSGKKGARVRRGSVARLVMNAPAGTVITRTRWSGGAVRSDCGYAMNVYAQNTGNGQAWGLFDTGKQCPKRNQAQASGDRRTTAANISANRVVLRMICRTAACSRRGKDYLRTSSLTATVADVQPPSVAITNAPQGWTNGRQTISYTASDNTGLRQVSASGPGEVDSFPCTLISTTPCPRQTTDSLVLNLNSFGEGTQPLSVAVADVSGLNSASSVVPVHVDFTPPPRVDTAVADGEGWRSTAPFQIAWANPDEGDRAPIVASRYTLCPLAKDTGCKTERVQGAGISSETIQPPGPGEWSVRTWREDAAGNQTDSAASNPVTLRYDPTPPEVAFGAAPSTDPTQVPVTVSDAVSSVASATIEASREGSGVWQQVPADRSGGQLTGRLDDAKLPPGRYQLRARAVDQAGNEKSAAGPTLQLPLRIATRLSAGRASTKVVRKNVRRKGKRRTVKKRITTFKTSAKIGYRRSATLTGTLTNKDGNPISGPVTVTEQSEITPAHAVGIAQADAKGRFSYRAGGTQTRTLTFTYLGTGTNLPTATQVKITVPAKAKITTSKRKLLNGGYTTFSGSVTTKPVPAGGKLVAIQAYIKPKHRRGRWSTFRTVRTDAAGRFSTRYRFVSTCERRYRWSIRAVIPKEAGVPYETGASRPTHVLVKGDGSC